MASTRGRARWGVAMDAGYRRELVLINAPWRGGLRVVVEDGAGSLVLDGGQVK